VNQCDEVASPLRSLVLILWLGLAVGQVSTPIPYSGASLLHAD
jgi:hypothetical protein